VLQPDSPQTRQRANGADFWQMDLWYNYALVKKMKVGSRIIWALVLTVLLAAQPVGAQTEVTRLTRVQVDLWPDYDRAAVLVLITGELPAGTALPAVVQLRLPAAAGEPTAVARITAEGDMLNTPYETESSGSATLVTLETAELTFRVEYYCPYERDGDSVRFGYQWLGGTPVDDLSILFREPLQAAAVATDTGFEDIGLQADGQRYHQWQVGAVGVDEILSASFSYVAPAAGSSVPASPPADSPSQDEGSALPIALAAIGGLLVGVGGGWFIASRRTPPRPSPGRKKRTPASSYCGRCGGQVKPGDDFCRQCGAQLR
jgi:hypothetical protein